MKQSNLVAQLVFGLRPQFWIHCGQFLSMILLDINIITHGCILWNICVFTRLIRINYSTKYILSLDRHHHHRETFISVIKFVIVIQRFMQSGPTHLFKIPDNTMHDTRTSLLLTFFFCFFSLFRFILFFFRSNRIEWNNSNVFNSGQRKIIQCLILFRLMYGNKHLFFTYQYRLLIQIQLIVAVRSGEIFFS